MMFPYFRWNFYRRFVVTACVVMLTTAVLFYRTYWIGIVQNKFRLNFIPEHYEVCEDLLRNRTVYGIELSQMYQLKSKDFDEAVEDAVGTEFPEGYSGEVMGEYLVMHHLAGQAAAKVICETGFNLGHSSFNYLTASEKTVVHSFDIGNYAYAHKMSNFLKKLFPNRFFIHFGDSTKTIPEFIRNNPEFQCDVMFVDGGHVYPVALADIMNFAKIANLKENIMIFDDYPTVWGKGFGKAWDDAIKEGIVKEFMRCTFQESFVVQRGFTIGRVMKKPVEEAVTTKTL